MSSLTTNLKLVKPELHDKITPTIFADNFDKIDAALEDVSGGALSLEEIEASTNLDGKIPSAAALKEVNNSLGGFTPIIDSTGKITGYKTKVGADTVFPFSDNDYIIKDGIILNGNSIIATDCASVKFTKEKGGAIYVVPTGSSVAKPQLLINIPQKAKFICATVLTNTDGSGINLKIKQSPITTNGLDKWGLCQDVSSLSGNYYVAFMTHFVSEDKKTDSRYIKDLWFEY